MTNHPSKPEHCILWASTILWDQERDISLDEYNEEHIRWVYEQSLNRGAKFHIDGITLESTKVVLFVGY